MEAKDTVMSQEEQWKVSTGNSDWTEQDIRDAQLLRQAEISFKAAKDEDIEIIRDTFNRGFEKGKQVRIKEVVEWLAENSSTADNYSSFDDVGFWVTEEKWQAKLKEWGMEQLS